ncbi:hypothetical protein [Nonomuraea guangzhouensis]|nr:hypothetical protein [Nonomuraea guangzhouensis]
MRSTAPPSSGSVEAVGVTVVTMSCVPSSASTAPAADSSLA